MSGIDLLLKTAIDYERTHQLAIFTLLSKSKFSSFLLGISDPRVLWEPERQLFDLGVQGKFKTVYIEIKMWSSLTENQQKRQQTFLISNNCTGYYILLGTSWFEYSLSDIENNFNGTATKIGYDEIISALNSLIVAPDQSPDVYELALAYRNALQEQFNILKNAFKNNDGGKLFFYSLYREIQNRTQNIRTSIYTVNNPGGPVYILNNGDCWKKFTVGNLAGELYYELVNGRLCIKFYSEEKKEDKYLIKDQVRKAVRSVLSPKYKVIDTGRLGTYMTACQIDHDFTDIRNLDKSAYIFQDIANEFDKIIKQI